MCCICCCPAETTSAVDMMRTGTGAGAGTGTIKQQQRQQRWQWRWQQGQQRHACSAAVSHTAACAIVYLCCVQLHRLWCLLCACKVYHITGFGAVRCPDVPSRAQLPTSATSLASACWGFCDDDDVVVLLAVCANVRNPRHAYGCLFHSFARPGQLNPGQLVS